MDLLLKGKVALVTGSSKGIGKGIAKILHDEGCLVVLNGRHKNSLKSTSDEIGSQTSYFVADVTKSKNCKNLIHYILKNYGRLDILVCNVGNGTSVPTGNETTQEWKKMFEINFLSTSNIIKESEKYLIQSKGSIVCISSIAGIEFTLAPTTYSISKAALNMYVRCMSKYLATNGVRINGVAPGNIIFQGSVWEKKMESNTKHVKKLLDSEVPLRKFGTPEDIGNIVSFLVSPKNSFITGEIIIVDGGQIRSTL